MESFSSFYHANEVRDFGAIPKPGSERPATQEFELATGLMEKLSTPEFEPESYADEYRVRMQAMIEDKTKGPEISVLPLTPALGHVIDLMHALKKGIMAKKSLEIARPRGKSEPAKRSKAR